MEKDFHVQIHNQFADSIIYNSIDGILAFDSDCRIIIWNPSMEKMSSIKREDAIGKQIFDLFPFLKETGEDQNIYRTLAGETIRADNTFYYVPYSNKTGYFDANYSPLKSSSDQVTGGLVFIHETTKRKRVEEKLRLEKDFSESLTNNSVDGILAFDRDLNYTVWNPQMEKITGISRNFAVGKNIFELYPHIKGTEDGERFYKTLKGESFHLKERRYAKREGFYEDHMGPLYNDAGQIIGGLAIIHDITELKEKENEIKKSRDYFLSLFDEFPSLIWIAGLDAKCNHFNKTWLAYTGKNLEQELGDGWKEGIHPQDRDRAFNFYIEKFNNRMAFEIEYRLRHHSGEYRWIAHIGRPYNDINGSFAGFIGSCYDITDRKLASEDLGNKNKVLDSILYNLPIVVMQLDQHGTIMQSRGVGLKKIGQRDNQAVGTNILNSPYKNYIKKALEGKSASFLSSIKIDNLSVHFNNYYFHDHSNGGAIGVLIDITDQKNIEEELREKNQILSGILNNLPVMMSRFDENGIIIESVGAGLRKTGVKDNELVGGNAFEMYPDFEHLLRNVLKGESISFVGVSRYANSPAYYQNYFFFDEEKGKGMIGFSIDITEQKTIEEKLRKSEALLTEAQKIANLGSWEWDIPTNTVSWSDELYRMYGYKDSSTKVSFETFTKHLHPEDSERVNGIIQQSYHTKEPFSFEHKIVHNDGVIRLVLCKGLVISDDKGNTSKMLGSILDITELKTAELKIRESEALLIEAQELARLGNWELDLRTGKITWSDELYRIYGFQPNEFEITKEKFVELSSTEAEQNFQHTLDIILKTKKPTFYEHHFTKLNGERVAIFGQAKPVFEANHNIIKITGYAQDITERKVAEEALQKAFEEITKSQLALKEINSALESRVKARTEELYQKNIELENKNKELIITNRDLDNFVYTASHDLKAPISNIEGLMLTLNDELSERTESVNLLLEMINASVQRFKETIGELTEITKIQKGIVEDEDYIEFDQIFEEVKLSIQEMIAGSEAIITKNFNAPSLRFSRKNLRSIIYNLVSNALKYKAPERAPRVTISTENKDGYILLTVKDNGLGMDSNNTEKIFGMFKRLHDHVEGSGIGLYIVKRVIDNAGGKIEVETVLGKGSTFKVYFKKD